MADTQTPQAKATPAAHTSGTVSIVMATYAGEVYLKEQFDSLCAQTRLPDELVIYDDASPDETVRLLHDLKADAPFPMTIIEGKQNIRVNGAFSAALAESNGEVIFFCDQDDIWEPQKIERMLAVMAQDPDIGMVFCDTSQIDQDGSPLPRNLWEAVGFNARRQQRFTRDPVPELLRAGPFTYGMASAFRWEAIAPFCPVLADPRGAGHDMWFAMHVAGAGWKAATIAEPLVRYRRHINQTSKIEGLDSSAGKQQWLQSRRQKAYAHIETLSHVRRDIASNDAVRSGPARDKALRQFSSKIRHLELREQLRESRSPILALRAAVSLGYWRYAKGPVSALRDIMGL